MKKSNLYTATGDKGTTSLVGGQRVPKTHARLEAYGTVDELNSFIGVLAATPGVSEDIAAFLRKVQYKLFNIGAYLATDNTDADEAADEATAEMYGISSPDVTAVEMQIDALDAQVPPLNKFVLPGGSPAAAAAHVCRTVARRAERRVIALSDIALVAKPVLIYLNRLSDYFFVLARYLNLTQGNTEIFWQKD